MLGQFGQGWTELSISLSSVQVIATEPTQL